METKKTPTYEIAIDRYLKGECPFCGRRMEKREKLGDHFCHKCKRAWTGEDVLSLKKELPTEAILERAAYLKPPSLFQKLKRIVLG